MKKQTNNNAPRKLSTSSLTMVKGGGDLSAPKLSVVTDGVEWTRTGYGEDPIKGMRDCD